MFLVDCVCYVLVRSRSGSISSTSSQINELTFFELLEQIPAPYVVRREKFDELVERLQRPNLVAEGVIVERRGSVKVGVGQLQMLLKLAMAMRHPEFGMLVESFTQTMMQEWCKKWLAIESSKDVDQILAMMVRSSFLNEKGSKQMRGYKLDAERIEEITRLLPKL